MKNLYYLIFGLLVFFSMQIHSGPKERVLNAKRGVLDLSKVNFEKSGAIDLSGDWEFYWNRLLKPKDFRVKSNNPRPSLYMPYKTWKNVQLNNEKLPEFGYATYRLIVKIPSGRKQMGIRIPETLQAHKLYVNGMVVSEEGKVGKDNKSEIPGGATKYAYFIPNSKKLELVLQISNFSYMDRGQNRTISFGLTNQIEAKKNAALATDALILGSIIIMGLYHVGMFIIRRAKMSPLFFGLFCFAIFMRTIPVGNGDFLHVINPHSSFKLEKLLEFIGFFFAVPTFGHLTYALFPRQGFKWSHITAWVSATLLTLVFLVLDPIYYPKLIRIFHLQAVFTILMSLVTAGRAVKQKKSGSLLFLVGLSVISFGAFNDILLARKVIRSIPMSHYALFTYIFIQAMLLFKMFAKAFTLVEVSEKQIRKMNIELVEKEKARTLFFHNTSHELRTPLNGIIGYINLLRMGRYGNLAREVVRQLKSMEDLAKGLKNQVNNILDLAKSKKGELKLTNSKISLREIADEIHVLSEGLVVRGHGTTFKLEKNWGEKEPDYINDREKLMTIIRNLVGNAVKFKDPDRENHILFTISSIEGGINLKIEDKGIGIPADQLTNVFSEFEQVERDADRRYEGTGLGLAMVKSLVELMGGTIHIESVEGKGTVFSLDIPSQSEVHMLQSEENQVSYEKVPDNNYSTQEIEQEQIEIENKSKLQLSAEKPYKILVVDDNEVNVHIVSEILKMHGYPVDEAYGGREAIEKIITNPPDLVLLDLMMPEVSGEDVIKSIRGDEATKSIPVILLTARGSNEDRIVGLGMGADDYLAKPIITDEVLLRVKNLLHRIDLDREKVEKEMIESRNEVINALLELGGSMQYIDNLDEFLQGVTDKLCELFPELNFAILIEKSKESQLVYKSMGNMEDHHQEKIFDNYKYIVHEFSTDDLEHRREFIGREVLGTDTGKLNELLCVEGDDKNWIMLGGDILGAKSDADLLHTLRLFIRGHEFNIASLDTLKVFLDQVVGGSRNKLLTAKLDRLAHSDNLTGAYNRAFLMSALDNELKLQEECSKLPFSIMMIDINGLKEVNDSCGHDDGDALICKCYDILKRVSRESDIVVRQGGDEFVVLCLNTSLKVAHKLLEDIRKEECEAKLSLNLRSGQKSEMKVQMAIGVASSEEFEPQDVLAEADVRMYEDKENWYKDNVRGQLIKATNN